MNGNTREEAVLNTLVDLGDNAELQEIYARIKCSGYVTITPDLYKQLKYYHTVRKILSNLVKKNQVERNSKGIYSITPEGLERLKKIAEIEEI
jgi:predicted transcriptional regulator